MNSGIMCFLFRVYLLPGSGERALSYTQMGQLLETRAWSSNSIHLLIKMIFVYVITVRFHAPECTWPEKCSDAFLVTADQGI